jgi:hypothetical protein
MLVDRDERTEAWILRFALRYSGDLLKSASSNARILEKQELRRRLDPQLRRVWERHPALRIIDRNKLREPVKIHDRWDVETTWHDMALHDFLYRRRVGASWFVPLITPSMEVHCHLALRFGRLTKVGTIFEGGDLDGRLKTLFDALAIPKDDNQLDSNRRMADEYLRARKAADDYCSRCD